MKTTQNQTIRNGPLHRLPKFSIPPECLVLRELKLLEMSERFGVRSPPAPNSSPASAGLIRLNEAIQEWLVDMAR